MEGTAVADHLGGMKKLEPRAIGPDMRVVGAKLVEGGWLVLAIGTGAQRCPDCGGHSDAPELGMVRLMPTSA